MAQDFMEPARAAAPEEVGAAAPTAVQQKQTPTIHKQAKSHDTRPRQNNFRIGMAVTYTQSSGIGNMPDIDILLLKIQHVILTFRGAKQRLAA